MRRSLSGGVGVKQKRVETGFEATRREQVFRDWNIISKGCCEAQIQ